jgi:peptidoglycan glycosyltransferase
VAEAIGGPAPGTIVRAHVLAFAALSVWPAYWQVVRSEELSFHNRNPRLLAVEREIRRGRILDRHDKVLAENGPEPGSRVQPAGPVASQIVGYRDDNYGLAGIEASRSGWLLGLASLRGRIEDVVRLKDRRKEGYDVRLTIDLDLQRRAWDRLGNRRGAIVAIDPASGDILALVSRPSFDPAHLQAAMDSGSDRSGLLARATQGLYPPGSAFKVFTASAALDSLAVTPDLEETCEGETVIDHDRIVCHQRGGHGTLRMEQAVAQSCNIYFAQVGRLLGPARFTEYARAFGIGEVPDIGIPVSASSVPGGRALTPAMLLESSFGQGTVQVTPLQMALIGSVIANRGIRIEPRLVMAALDGGQVIAEEPRGRATQVLSSEAAERVAQFMRTTAASGTARPGAVPGVVMAAKTGSAENPHGKTHAWFVAFAPYDSPRIVVAVVVENGGAGGAVAGPISRDVMAYWLSRR